MPITRRDWIKSAHTGGPGWDLAGWLLIAVIIIAILDAIFN